MVFRGQSTKYKCLENFALYGSLQIKGEVHYQNLITDQLPHNVNILQKLAKCMCMCVSYKQLNTLENGELSNDLVRERHDFVVNSMECFSAFTSY